MTSTSADNSSPQDGGVQPPNPYALDMLAALMQFLRPIISIGRGQGVSNESEVVNSREGQQLVSALTDFVNAAVSSPVKSGSESEFVPQTFYDQQGSLNQSEDIIDSQDTFAQQDATEPSQAFSIIPVQSVPKHVPSTELEIMTLTAARAHVFNKMPIRLLAFDSSGANLRLIDRNETFSRILPNVYAGTSTPKFQADWVKAELLHDIHYSQQFRKKEMTRLLQDVVEHSAPYAILSHTWIRDSPGDVIYQDWATREDNPRGYAKVANFCSVAARDHGMTLGWIDSICINKESSTELDESIRSMYNWYRGAHVCITYLAETEAITDAIRDSWFTRGWTLQELLAPVNNFFYNLHWKKLGSSDNNDIKVFLQSATTIKTKELDLCRIGHLERIPLSRRMQLACGRQVTREEDSSYSLMGILGVDISIAYGEGSERAFYRLFRELLNTKKDIVDLFNRGYDFSNKLIPSSIELYSARQVTMDLAAGGSALDKYQPIEPIILTHLGVRMPLILMPALYSSVKNAEYVPRGDFSGHYTSSFTLRDSTKVSFNFNLADTRLFEKDADIPETPPQYPNLAKYRVQMFATTNFGIDGAGNILLSQTCMALRVRWVGLEDRILHPKEPVALPAGSASFIRLKSADKYSIPKEELGKHGFQLVTLYL